MLERELQGAVIEMARVLGWRVAHFRPAQTSKGWRTPVAADGKGFPDLTWVRGGRLVFAELKATRGGLGLDQVAWLDALGRCPGVEVYVWRPADWISRGVERVLAAHLAREAE